jgi:hypothetical protein
MKEVGVYGCYAFQKECGVCKENDRGRTGKETKVSVTEVKWAYCYSDYYKRNFCNVTILLMLLVVLTYLMMLFQLKALYMSNYMGKMIMFH